MFEPQNQKIFKCGFCDKRYTRKESLNKHLRIRADLKQFKCPHCCLSFTIKSNLSRHQKAKHATSRISESDSQNLINTAVVQAEQEPPGTDYLLPVVHASLEDMQDFTKFIKEKIEDEKLDVFGAVKVCRVCFFSPLF